MDSKLLAKTYISLKFTRLGDIIRITKELFLCWTFHTPGPNNRRETYPMEITGIFEDRVARKGLTGKNRRRREGFERGGMLFQPGERGVKIVCLPGSPITYEAA